MVPIYGLLNWQKGSWNFISQSSQHSFDKMVKFILKLEKYRGCPWHFKKLLHLIYPQEKNKNVIHGLNWIYLELKDRFTLWRFKLYFTFCHFVLWSPFGLDWWISLKWEFLLEGWGLVLCLGLVCSIFRSLITCLKWHFCVIFYVICHFVA